MGTAEKFVDGVVQAIVNPLIAILFAVAIVIFFWGLVQFIYSQGDKEEGKQHMLWGVIGVFIMLSAYGILKIFTNSFGIPLN